MFLCGLRTSPLMKARSFQPPSVNMISTTARAKLPPAEVSSKGIISNPFREGTRNATQKTRSSPTTLMTESMFWVRIPLRTPNTFNRVSATTTPAVVVVVMTGVASKPSRRRKYSEKTKPTAPIFAGRMIQNSHQTKKKPTLGLKARFR